MGIDSNNLQIAIGKNFSSAETLVLQIGSNSDKDLDIAFINTRYSFFEVSASYSDFIKKVSPLFDHLDKEIILKHDHRIHLDNKSKYFHLLFYPSIEHLKYWELPSFIKSIYDSGIVLGGDKKILEEYSKVYIDFNEIKYNQLKFHISKYDKIAIISLIYNFLESNIYSKKCIIENLIYILRYTLIDLIKDKENIRKLWEWQFLIETIYQEKPELEFFAKLLEDRKKLFRHIDRNTINDLLHKYFELSRRKLKTNK